MGDARQDAVIRGIAAFGLPGVADPEPTVIADVEWHPLLGRVRDQRITGQAVQSVAGGWLELTEEQTEQLLSAHRRAMTWCLALERKLVGISQGFRDAGIEHAVLKGPAVAHSAYPDPSLRSFADLDLLVPTGDYERACALLEERGHIRRLPEPRRGFDVRFGKASVHTLPEDGIEVDLHRTLVLGPFGVWMHPEELLDHRDRFSLGGEILPRLDDTGMLLNVALHAVLGGRRPRLVPLRDVLQVSSEGEVDLDRLVRWAREWRLSMVLRYAFEAASATLSAPVPPQALRILVDRTPKREARALGAYMGERRGRGAIPVATLGAIRGIRPRLAYVSALVAPRRTFLAARGGDGSSYARRWRVPARWAKRWLVGLKRDRRSGIRWVSRQRPRPARRRVRSSDVRSG